MDETLANYLVSGWSSSLRALTLSSKLLKTSSCLNDRAYTAAGQAGAVLHALVVLRPTRPICCGTPGHQAICCSVGAMVATERHLWELPHTVVAGLQASPGLPGYELPQINKE